MGRPLNKKYFGNRNIGTTGAGDDGIGGSRVASVTLTPGNLGSYTTRPTITFSDPDLLGAGGVRATGTVTSEILSAVTSNGTTGTGYVVGDLVTFTGIDGVVGYVATVGTGVGEIQSITFTQVGTSRSSFEALPGATSGVDVVGGSGTLGKVNILFRAKAVAITEKGSGYVTAPTSTPTQSVTFTSVALTTDSGAPGSSTNQENAITPYAYVTGGTRKIADIIRQVGGRRYKVKTADGTMTCSLKTSAASNAAGEMDLTATDSSGKTYYVKKLTGHKATLVRYGSIGWEFASDTAVQWTFDAPTLNTTVQIANA